MFSTAFRGCGDDDDAPSGETGSTEGADVVDVGAMDRATGDIAFCMGKDTSGNLTSATKSFDEEFPDVNVELIEFSTSADEQRAQFVLPDRPGLRAADVAEVYATGAEESGIVYQGAPYEGLTVDFLELAFAAGGQVLSEDGRSAALGSSSGAPR